MRTICASRSGAMRSILDSRWPRGRWTALGMCPSSHSSCSRTSTTSGGEADRAQRPAQASRFRSISALVCARCSRYVGMSYLKTVAAARFFRCPPAPGSTHSSARSLPRAAAAVVVAVTALTADHPPRAAVRQAAVRRRLDGAGACSLAGRCRGRGRLGAAAPRAREPASGVLVRPAQSRPRALLAAGRRCALAAWRQAKRVQPDTPSAVRAGDLLHPNSPRGLPQFQPSFARG